MSVTMSGIIVIAIIVAIITCILILIFGDSYEMGQNLFGAICIIAVVFGIWDIIGSARFNSMHEIETIEPLYVESAFTDKGFEANGAFILGIGGFNGSSYTEYIVYGRFNKGLRRVDLDVHNTYVNERNNEQPRVTNYFIKTVWDSPDHWFWTHDDRHETKIRTNIYDDLILIVPKNTIKREFKLE